MSDSINNQKSKIRNFLTQHSTLTLATVNVDGKPQSAPLFFACDDDTLIFFSSPKSRHSLNIEVNGKAAVTVHNETWNWEEIAGVQMEGEAHLIPLGAARDHAWEIYKKKFPFVVEFEAEVSRSELYRFTPKWIRLIDNSVSFGYREEIRLE
jgi:uncharacterized protein YhbP (UPF0306 family)